MIRFLISTTFSGAVFIRGRYFSVGGAYFHLSLKPCDFSGPVVSKRSAPTVKQKNRSLIANTTSGATIRIIKA